MPNKDIYKYGKLLLQLRPSYNSYSDFNTNVRIKKKKEITLIICHKTIIISGLKTTEV